MPAGARRGLLGPALGLLLLALALLWLPARLRAAVACPLLRAYVVVRDMPGK